MTLPWRRFRRNGFVFLKRKMRVFYRSFLLPLNTHSQQFSFPPNRETSILLAFLHISVHPRNRIITNFAIPCFCTAVLIRF